MNPHLEARIRALIRREIDAGHVPGGSFGLWQRGREVLSVVEGAADLRTGAPLRRDSLFRVYSMSKPITSAAVMMLVEEGRLRLEDRVSDYLPEYARLTVCAPRGGVRLCRREMTVGHLMTMTSGIVYPDVDAPGRRMQSCFDAFEADNMAGRGPTTRELACRVAGQPLAFEPGEDWRYGLSADVLGAIVEVAAGVRFGDFLRERLFAPLGMDDTGFWVPPEKQARFAPLYKSEGGRLAVDSKRHLGLTLCLTPPTFESGGAGIVSSLDDYARFGCMLAAGGVSGGRRFLSAETLRRFGTGVYPAAAFPGLGTEHMAGYAYGFLMRALRDPSKIPSPGSVGEFGWEGWAGTYMCVDPARETFMVFMTQVGGYNEWPLYHALRTIAADALV